MNRIIFALTLLILASCNKSNDGAPLTPPPTELVGIWMDQKDNERFESNKASANACDAFSIAKEDGVNIVDINLTKIDAAGKIITTKGLPKSALVSYEHIGHINADGLVTFTPKIQAEVNKQIEAVKAVGGTLQTKFQMKSDSKDTNKSTMTMTMSGNISGQKIDNKEVTNLVRITKDQEDEYVKVALACANTL